MLNGPRPDAQERRRRLLAIRYDGKPLGDHELQMRTEEPGEIEFAKEFGEAIAFGHLAVGARLNGDIVEMVSVSPPEPDLLVTLTDGRQVYVEVAQVTEEQSARASATIRTINKHIHNRAAADSTFERARQGRGLTFFFPDVPTSRETKPVADEMVAVFYATSFGTVDRRSFVRPESAVAPILNRLGVKYVVSPDGPTFLSAQLDANCFDPAESVDDLDKRLADKMSKVYAPGKPIWLALALNDLMQVPSLTMEALRARLPTTIGQFELVVIGTMEEAAVLSALSPDLIASKIRDSDSGASTRS